MAQHLMVDEVGFRFGLGGGLLFVTTGAIVAGGALPAVGVGVLLAVTTVTAFAFDLWWALALGVVGWAFATGFAVNNLGALTLSSGGLLLLAAFLAAATLAAWIGRAR
jgi:hypothetical protein